MSRSDINSSTIRGKREEFEAQLRSLQSDIGLLSQKLSIPIATIPTATKNATAENPTSYGPRTEISTPSSNEQFQSQASGTKPSKKIVSFDSASKQKSTTSPGNTSILSQKKAEVVRLSKELRTMSREKDDLQYRYEQLKRETDDIKKTLSDFGRLRALCENLQQDNDSLKMSLESSEKIRKQQKELIVMMQRSTQYNIENSSQASSVGYQASQLNTSISSFGGTSMTSATDRSVGFQPTSSAVTFSPSHTSVTDEHRDWLSTQSAPASVPATVLASPAVSAVPKFKATGDQVAPVVQKLTRKVSPKSKKSAVTHGNSTRSTPSSISKGRTTKRVASTTAGNTSTGRSGSASKKAVRKEKGTVTKKTTKIKRGEGTKNSSLQAAAGYPSGGSMGSQSSTGVFSFDRIMTSGITGNSSSPYGHTSSHILQPSFHPHDHQQHHHYQADQPPRLVQQPTRGKPPRPPVRRPSSANSTERRSRPRTQEEHPSTRPLRSHSLTSGPLTWSQFNILHSPYRSSTQPTGSKRKSTHMSARRGQR